MNLLGKDVSMTGVTSDFGNHANVDEPQAHGPDKVMINDIVESETSSQLIRPSPCPHLLTDHIGQGLIIGDQKAAIAASGMAITFRDTHAPQSSLEPDTFGRSAVLDQ